jgi:hypothetical protein
LALPLVAALGLGLASTIEGRNPIIDGFGLIAFASLFPIMSVLAYAQITDLATKHLLAFLDLSLKMFYYVLNPHLALEK